MTRVNIILQGALGSRPAAGVVNRIYFATDAGAKKTYQDTGSTWNLVGVTEWADLLNKPTTFNPTAQSLDWLSDVVASSPSTDDVLKYNGTNWVPAGVVPLSDGSAQFKGNTDATKLLRIDVGTVATGTTRVLTMPNANVNLGDLATSASVTDHLNDTSDAHDASAISYAGGTGMSATDVEAAIDELATEKLNATAVAYETVYWTFDGAAVVTTGNKRVPVTATGTIVKAWATASTAPTGAALIFDINLSGSTIWSTSGNRVQIAASANSGTQATFNTTAVTEDQYLTCDIDQIGSTAAGSNIVVALKYRYAL